MDMSGAVTRPRFLLVAGAAAFWACILYFHASAHTGATERAVSFASRGDDDPCLGRYVYMQELPPRFNADILSGCSSSRSRAEGPWTDMCEQVSNAGLGKPLLLTLEVDGESSGEALTGTSWYATQQFALDAIFHGRMRQYECLTNDSSAAAAVFVPFYAGFEFTAHQRGYDNATRDAASIELERWLTRRPEWRRAGGRDHFLVAGRTAWEFQRDNNADPAWGTNLLLQPAAKNMTFLVLESSGLGNDMAVPYPTYFHPRTDADVLDWQRRIRIADRRPWLVSFVGAPRPGDPRSIRSEIIAQCDRSSKCRKLNGAKECHDPAAIMRLFRSSTFCLQPAGDTYTRRSTFDAMLAGCVPVFFHPASTYLQYRWHLPTDSARYSVLIPEDGVRTGNVSIEETLRRIPLAAVREMQEEVVRLLPTLVYADPRYPRLDTVKDAFDVAVDGVVHKVREMRKRELGVRRSSTTRLGTWSEEDN